MDDDLTALDRAKLAVLTATDSKKKHGRFDPVVTVCAAEELRNNE
jgi:hypothetical protein